MGAEEGRLRVVVAAAVAPGVEAVITQEYGLRWELLCAVVQVTTDPTVINRYLQVSVTMGVVLIHVMPSNLAVAAGVTRSMYFGAGVGNSFTGGGVDDAGVMPVGLTVNGQAVLSTYTVNIQAGDQVNGFALLVREWLEPQ